MDYGFLSLLPVLVVIILAFFLKKDIEALVIGSLVGAIILAGKNFGSTYVNAFYVAFCGETISYIFLVGIVFGALMGILNAMGGIEKFSQSVTKYVKSMRAGMVVSWLLGIVLFIDDYMHAMVAGSAMKKVTDKYGISRNTLAFLTQHTAGPAVVLLPMTVWSSFYISLFLDNNLPEQLGMDGFSIYMHSLPYVLYAFVAIILSFLVAVGVVPLTKKLKAEPAAIQTADEVADTAADGKEAKGFYFYLPMLVVVFGTIITGGDLTTGICLGIIVAIAIIAIFHVITLNELHQAILDGVCSLLPALLMLLLTFTLLEINTQLGTTDYVISIAQPLINAKLLPAIVFLVVAVLCFCTGSFWGNSALILPIVAPMAISMGCNIFVVIGAIISGAVWGSNTCIYGDCVILSATSCDVEPVEHAMSQMVYCFAGGAVALLGYLILGFIG